MFISAGFSTFHSNEMIVALCKKMKFSIKNFFGKCYQIRSFLQIWSHLLKKSLMENFNFCGVAFMIWFTLN